MVFCCAFCGVFLCPRFSVHRLDIGMIDPFDASVVLVIGVKLLFAVLSRVGRADQRQIIYPERLVGNTVGIGNEGGGFMTGEQFDYRWTGELGGGDIPVTFDINPHHGQYNQHHHGGCQHGAVEKAALFCPRGCVIVPC